MKNLKLIIFALLFSNAGSFACATQLSPREDERIRPQRVKFKYYPTEDEAFKIIFGEEGCQEITKEFLNSVYGFNGEQRIKQLTFINTEMTEMNSKSVRLDVRVICNCINHIGEIFIIEMQKASMPGWVNRFVYYGAESLVKSGEKTYSEVARNKFYDSLKPSHVLTVLNYDSSDSGTQITRERLGNSEDLLVEWDIRESKTLIKVSPLMDWKFLILPRLDRTTINETSSMLEKWAYFIGTPTHESEVILPKFVCQEKSLLDAYGKITWELDKEKKDRLNVARKKELDLLATLEGVKAGVKAEMATKIAEAKAETADKMTKMVKNMINKNMETKDIAEIANVDLDFVEQIRNQ